MRPPQRELLQLAFDAASAMPTRPHAKNRSRAQDEVVRACFQLGDAELALGFGLRIEGWRRGCVYADFAAAMAARGDRARAADYVDLALGVAKAERGKPDAQEWRHDLIVSKAARAVARLGDAAAAEALARDIDPASANAVDEAWVEVATDRIARLPAEALAAEFAAIDRDFLQRSLGQQAVALGSVARLHERGFADRELRARCEERVATAWHKVMPALRLTTLATMVKTDLAGGDATAAKALLAAMRGIVESHRWRAEDRLPELARLVELAVAVGERERAQADFDAALAAYHRERDGIVDIWRARTLRPLALAAVALGDTAAAESLLALVLEEGMENPNSRPRCDDLVATCVALATRAITPAPATLARMREIQRGLGEPW